MKIIMKNKIAIPGILLSGLLLLGISSCSKDDFKGERPDQKLTAALESYSILLTEAPHGWKAHLFTGSVGGYGFWFEFNKENKVSMFADFRTESGNQAAQSSYRLKATLLPALYFDTYSYLHELADPDNRVNGGTAGWGLLSDFEFSFREVKGDTILLTGNLNNSKLQLVKASAAEKAAYQRGNLNALRADATRFFQTSSFLFLKDNANTVYSVNMNISQKTVAFNYSVGQTMETALLGFAFSGENDLILSEPFIKGGIHIDRFIRTEVAGAPVIKAALAKETMEIQKTENPLFPFFLMWGSSYQLIRVPIETTSQGNKSDFDLRRTAALTAMRALLRAGTTFPEMRIAINKSEKLVVVNQIIRQTPYSFNANFAFSYTEQDNAIKLKYEGPMDGNSTVIEPGFKPIIDGLTDGAMEFDFDLTTPQLRAFGQSKSLTNFRFVGLIN
ncbi:DUF4302 domain-containing protein [Sphingobacterium humi]|uniref:DUF4302 domain-containing protein n=2 Tax=Sphingobacterium humi TaxID=1796905 RepID=A0A6N8L5G5_9SPHI|nr:DUF4302 domain-containing protein [Sphingobacterium humi]